MVGNAQAEPSRDHHTVRALSQGNIARNRAERQAEPIQRRHREAVLARHGRTPEALVIQECDRPPLNIGKRSIDIIKARTRNHPFNRHPSELSPQSRQNAVFESVEGGKVDMAALGFNHLS